MVMLHIKFKGTTYTVTLKKICAVILKSFIKKLTLFFRLNYTPPSPGIFKFLDFFFDNLNSGLAKTGFMQSIGLRP